MIPRLPHHRRRNWRILCRNHYRAIWLGIAALLLAGLIVMGEQFMLEQHAKLDAQNAYATMLLDITQAVRFGSPGYVVTDWEDGTADLNVGKVR